MLMKIKFLSFLLFTLVLGLFSAKTAFAANFQLSGKVSDSSNNPIQNTTITVNNSQTNNIIGTTTDDSSGNYSLSVPEGTYNVTAAPPSSSGFQSVANNNVTINNDTILNFVLVHTNPLVTITGKITDPQGNGIGGLTVEMNNANSDSTTRTNSSGDYSLQITTGSTGINMSNGNYSVGGSGLNITGDSTLNITLPFKKLSVNVEDQNNQPLAGVQVGAGSTSNHDFQITTSLGNITNVGGDFNFNAVTDSTGTAVMNVLPAIYSVSVNPSSPYSATQVTGVDVTSDTSTTVNLQATVTVSGKITDPQGNGIGGLTVEMNNANSDSTTRTNSSGDYSLQITTGSTGINMSNGNYSIGASSAFNITGDSTLNITLPFKKLSVNVEDPNNQPLANVQVGSETTNPNFQVTTSLGNFTNSAGDFTFGAVTDSAGTAVMNVLPGTYTVFVNPSSPYSATQVTGVDVASDTSTTVNLQATVTVSGKITDPQGNGIGGLTVEMNNANSDSTTRTNSSGDYSLQITTGSTGINMSNGNYSIGASSAFNITGDSTLNITLPFKKLSVNVEDPNNQPLANVQVGSETTNPNFQVTTSLGNFTNSAGDFTFGAVTDSAGTAVMNVLPGTYTVFVNPSSPYSATQVTGVNVTSDTNIVVSLQSSNPTPTPTSTPTPTPIPTYKLSGYVYNDDNQNGNQEGGELGYNNATVTLDTGQTAQTDQNGYYEIDNLQAGTYNETLTVPNGYIVTTPNPVNVSLSQDTTENFGIAAQPTPTPTNTPTPTPTNTPTPTPTNTPTSTPTPTPTPIQITSVSPAKVWVGLKTSDDNGVKFDLKAEVYKDSTLITSGEEDSVAAGSSGFNNAKLDTINFDSFSPLDFPSGSQLKVELYVRNACTGSPHNSGIARLWYNDSAANSQFGATIGVNANNYFLLDGLVLGTSVGSGPKKTIDVQSGAICSAFKPFGTWTITP